jgi:hypothetical protein
VAIMRRDEAVSEQVAYARRLIAMRFYEPRATDGADEAALTGWHGYSDTVAETAKKFGVDPGDPALMRGVELAVQEAALSLADTAEGRNPELRRQAMRLRLQHLLQLCHSNLNAPQVETTWKWEPDEVTDPATGKKRMVRRKVKAKEKITTGTNTAVIAQANALEIALANLDQLAKPSNQNTGTSELIAALMGMSTEQDANGNIRRQSMATMLMSGGLQGMDPQALQRLKQDAEEVMRSGRKPVESRVVQSKEETGEDD